MEQQKPQQYEQLNLKIKTMNGTVYPLSISTNQDYVSLLSNIIEDVKLI